MATTDNNGTKTPAAPKLSNEIIARFNRDATIREDNGNKELTLLKFSIGNRIQLTLKAVSQMDPRAHTYGPITLKQIFMTGGKFADFLTESKDIDEFAEFLKDYAISVKGVQLSSSVVLNDTEQAKEFLAGFKTD